jgi:hypothetical protein
MATIGDPGLEKNDGCCPKMACGSAAGKEHHEKPLASAVGEDPIGESPGMSIPPRNPTPPTVPYYEFKGKPGLSAEVIKQRLPQALSDATLPGMTRDRLVVRHDAVIGVVVKVFQVPGGALFRVNRVLCPANVAIRAFILVLCAGIPVIGFALAISMAFWGRGTAAAVAKSLGSIARAGGGAFRRIPWSEGVRRAQPGWYRTLGIFKLIVGLAIAGFAIIQVGSHWYRLDARDMVVVVPLAVVAVSFGLRWLFTGTIQLFLKPAPLKLSLAVAVGGGLASMLLCPALFWMYWNHVEESEWRRNALYDYISAVPDAIQRPDALLQLAKWRAGQLREGITEYYVKSDLEHVTFVIEQFHPADPAFQPAYEIAKKALAEWKG